MSAIVGVVAMSHSPFWDSREFAVNDGAFLTAVARARDSVQATEPTAIVVIGPDHFRNFFYDVMPAFCIGTDQISSFGDYRTPRDDLPAASGLARSMHGSLMALGFDPALSLHMGVDHGITQPYALFAPQLDLPLVPIMVACTGPAKPSLRRCAALGRAIGTAVRESDGHRVLIVGSGGLSHWLPPTDPDHLAVDPELRRFIIDGRASAREIRTWITAASAWGAAMDVYGYEPQPAWLTGTACAAAFAG